VTTGAAGVLEKIELPVGFAAGISSGVAITSIVEPLLVLGMVDCMVKPDPAVDGVGGVVVLIGVDTGVGADNGVGVDGGIGVDDIGVDGVGVDGTAGVGVITGFGVGLDAGTGVGGVKG